MSQHQTAQPHQAALSTYIFGFVASLVLTIVAYSMVEYKLASGMVVVVAILALAVLQAIIQLICFLHLGREDKPRWNAIFLINTISIILIVVIGSVWIMNNLNSRMMSPQEMDKYMIDQSKKGY